MLRTRLLLYLLPFPLILLAIGAYAVLLFVRLARELDRVVTMNYQSVMAAQLQEFRRSTSAEIVKLHRTMQATLASFPDPVYVLSPEGAIELENPSAQALSRSLTTRGGLPPALDALVESARKSGVPHLPNDFKEVICVRHDAQERFYLPRILVDIPRIRHVFDNLLSNAIKQSPVGGRIVMRTTLNADGNVEFSVHDDGPGIAPEFHARIFERFFRVPGQAKGGVGLGLSIAREIVLAHGGYLGVRSQPAQGTEFYFTLPPIVLAAPAADTP